MTQTLNVCRKVCAIDIGTNSTRCMIADIDGRTQRIHVLYQDTKITRLGAGIGDGKIHPDNAGKTLDTVKKYCQHARSLGTSDYRIFGTAVLREMYNREDFCRTLSRCVGHPLVVLDGRREAQHTEEAIASSLSLEESRFVGLDIGGGSAQIIFHNPAKPSLYQSLPLGAVRLTEKFLRADPPTAAQVQSLKTHLRDILRSDVHILPPENAWALVGVGGTITTVAAMVQELKTYDHDKIHGSKITEPQWERILENLIRIPAAQRLSFAGLAPGREDIIVAGIFVLDAVAEHLKVKEVTVSDRGVLYGMLVEYLKEMNA